jgi:hypothetical protein
MSDTSNWKNAEKLLSKIYNKFGIPSNRVSRAANYSVSDFDVRIENAEWVKSDSKYTKRPFRHHGLIREGEFKYCKSKGDFFVLFTKNFSEPSGMVTIRAEFFAALLSYWLGCETKEKLEGILND